MANVRDTLALLVKADAKGAISELEKVGNSADKHMGKARSSTDRWAAGLTKGGAAAVGFAGLASAALFSFAKKSEEAEHQQIKLDNALATTPTLAGANKKAFLDLADAIHNKTVVDDDAVVGAEALLAQFKLTQKQILGLTPLVVDLSRKMGVDLDVAAKTVGKAMAGNQGALKKVGIVLDENAFKTDRYAAIQKGLTQAVGGFAEREGKTFSGRLEILKNQLGDVEEGIGSGVVDAVSSAIGPVTKLSHGFKSLGADTQHTVGVVATIGTAGVGAAGGLSFLAGVTLRMRDRFSKVTGEGQNATRTLTGFGKAAAGIGLVSGFAAVAYSLKGLNDETTKLKLNIDKLAGSSTQALVDKFDKLGKTVGGFGKVKVGSVLGLAEFDELANKSLGTAIRLRDGIASAGGETSRYDEIIKKATATQKQKTQDDKAGAAAVDSSTDSTKKNAEAINRQKTALEKAERKLHDYTDAIYGSRDAARAQTNASLDVASALDDLKAKTDDARKAGGKNAEANRDVLRSYNDVQGSIDGVAAAAARTGDEQAKLRGKTLSARDSAKLQRTALEGLRNTIAPDSPFRTYLDGLITDLDKAAKTRKGSLDIKVTANGVKLGPNSTGIFRSGPVQFAAEGGPVRAGHPVVVGEKGPELFLPKQSGTIIPHGRVPHMSALGGGAVNNHYTLNVQAIDPTSAAKVIIAALKDYERSNGRLPFKGN